MRYVEFALGMLPWLAVLGSLTALVVINRKSKGFFVNLSLMLLFFVALAYTLYAVEMEHRADKDEIALLDGKIGTLRCELEDCQNLYDTCQYILPDREFR